MSIDSELVLDASALSAWLRTAAAAYVGDPAMLSDGGLLKLGRHAHFLRLRRHGAEAVGVELYRSLPRAVLDAFGSERLPVASELWPDYAWRDFAASLASDEAYEDAFAERLAATSAAALVAELEAMDCVIFGVKISAADFAAAETRYLIALIGDLEAIARGEDPDGIALPTRANAGPAITIGPDGAPLIDYDRILRGYITSVRSGAFPGSEDIAIARRDDARDSAAALRDEAALKGYAIP